jgi:hypothetical protein
MSTGELVGTTLPPPDEAPADRLLESGQTKISDQFHSTLKFVGPNAGSIFSLVQL